MVSNTLIPFDAPTKVITGNLHLAPRYPPPLQIFFSGLCLSQQFSKDLDNREALAISAPRSKKDPYLCYARELAIALNSFWGKNARTTLPSKRKGDPDAGFFYDFATPLALV